LTAIVREPACREAQLQIIEHRLDAPSDLHFRATQTGLVYQLQLLAHPTRLTGRIDDAVRCHNAPLSCIVYMQRLDHTAQIVNGVHQGRIATAVACKRG